MPIFYRSIYGFNLHSTHRVAASRMSGAIKFALAQINPTVGDIAGNLAKIIAHCRVAHDELASDAVIFPELALCGYPPEDLLLRDDFMRQCAHGLAELLAFTKTRRALTVMLGHPLAERGKVFNALSVLANGEVRACYRKRHLPNYAVFDEKRYFTAGRQAQAIDLNGVRIGLTVCEDIWQRAPLKQAREQGAELIVSINASPFHDAQASLREQGVVLKKARQFNLPILYLNQVGGQDELVFDGCSVVVNGDGRVAARLPAFRERLAAVVFQRGKFIAGEIASPPQGAELIYQALVLGVRDYVEKNGFQGLVLGLSGGLDSALSLAIAADAVGAQRVLAVMMPSRYTSDLSLEEARKQASLMRVRYQLIPLQPLVCAATAQLAPIFTDLGKNGGGGTDAKMDITDQNIQARGRGLLLMAISNQLGYLVLNTGNKSELAVGYATLYGDMVGGFAALKDVPKSMVYRLARYRNTVAPVIGERVLRRAPSAELAPDQRDQDSLPPYETLDPILEAFIQHDHSAQQIIAAGHDPETVRRVIRMVAANEHKRRQAPPGVRVTSRAFGKDRRYPITSKFFSMPG